MHSFYIQDSQIKNNNIIIIGPDVNHIKNVLRLSIGSRIKVLDRQSKEYYCIIKEMNKEEILLDIEDIKINNTELQADIILFQGLPKKDKMELIIQKAVELGVKEIVPVMTKRVIVKIDDEKKELKKLERWQAIAENAAKQSKRGIIPQVRSILKIEEAIDEMRTLDISLMPYENEKGISYTKEIINSLNKCKTIGIFIGPEGGFDEKEVDKAKENGILPITLGRRILRTETAGLAILSMIMLELEE